MPLLDHFRPPLSEERHWESVHSCWAGSLADDLNRILPAGYVGEEQSHAGLVLDVLARESIPAPVATIPATFCDDFKVRVISRESGPRLVAAIELVSPRNKDRPTAQHTFALKCASDTDARRRRRL